METGTSTLYNMMEEGNLLTAILEWKFNERDPTALTALCIDILPTAAAMCRVPILPKLCSHCFSCRPQVPLRSFAIFVHFEADAPASTVCLAPLFFALARFAGTFNSSRAAGVTKFPGLLYPYDSDRCKSCMPRRWYMLIWVQTGRN